MPEEKSTIEENKEDLNKDKSEVKKTGAEKDTNPEKKNSRIGR